MFLLLTQAALMIAGATIHALVDRSEDRRTKRRVVELFLMWLVGVSGFLAIFEGFGHIGPTRAKIAESIGPGYIPSMFQWENAWADIAVGVALVCSLWRRNGFLTAAILIWTILYWGDAIGHIMQLTVHDNRAVANVYSIPSDILIPLAAGVLLVVYRRLSRPSSNEEAATGSD